MSHVLVFLSYLYLTQPDVCNTVLNMLHKYEKLKTVAGAFDVEGEFISACPYGSGHINDTYLGLWLVGESPVNYILQRINHNVFASPPKLMENIVRVTSHYRNKLSAVSGSDTKGESLTVVPSRDGLAFYRDSDGYYWRMYIFISRAKTFDVCNDIGHAREAARAVGQFQKFLEDMPGGRLHETIPFFHHTPRRYQALEQAVETDSYGRRDSSRDSIKFCMERRGLVTAITSLIEEENIPERIAHNDAKFNNVMIDNSTGRAVCMIDLDTVMSGCSLYDFGDLVRTIARTAEEDERNISKVAMNITAFEALVSGYIDSTGSMLTPLEIESLPLAGKVITFTIGIRFLTDYLSGDIYFKTHRSGHNLDRARVQFKMLESMEQQEKAMKDIVRKYSRKLSPLNTM